MPFLELTHLTLKPTLSPNDPVILTSLVNVRTLLASKVHRTNSRFYVSVSNPREIYILGSWPTIAAHHAFLASPIKTEILGPQEHVFDFQWGIHIPLPEGEKGGMENLPLNAPVLAIARLFIKPEKKQTDEYQRVLDKYRHLISDATKPWAVFDGWRCDAPDGEPEAVMLSGWESEGGHDEFRVRVRGENEEYAGIRETYRGMSVVHVRYLEA
jgi:hypothetical protein